MRAPERSHGASPLQARRWLAASAADNNGQDGLCLRRQFAVSAPAQKNSQNRKRSVREATENTFPLQSLISDSPSRSTNEPATNQVPAQVLFFPAAPPPAGAVLCAPQASLRRPPAGCSKNGALRLGGGGRLPRIDHKAPIGTRRPRLKPTWGDVSPNLPASCRGPAPAGGAGRRTAVMVLTRGEHFHSEIPGTEVTQVCLGEAASDARRGRGRTTSPLCKQARVPPTAAARPLAPWPSQGSTTGHGPQRHCQRADRGGSPQ